MAQATRANTTKRTKREAGKSGKSGKSGCKIAIGSLVQIRNNPKIERDQEEMYGFVIARDRIDGRAIVARIGLVPCGIPFEAMWLEDDELTVLASPPEEMEAVKAWRAGLEGAGMMYYRIKRRQVERRNAAASPAQSALECFFKSAIAQLQAGAGSAS